MKLGLVMTIRNERAQLRRNLLYHRLAGVDKVYLYLDRCTDGSPDTVADLSFVQVAPTTDPESICDRPGARTYVKNSHHVSARQALNVIHTLELAAADGIDWLIHIDADELVSPRADDMAAGELKQLLDSVSDSTECVRFRPYEVCPRRLEYDNVFADETLFVPPGAGGKRRLLDPIDGSKFSADLRLGHRKGKMAVRVTSDIAPRGPHEFLHLDRSRPQTTTRGLLLHFYLHSFSQFVQKFRNMADRPSTWIGGKPIRRQKRLWRDMVNSPDFDEDELRSYFERWILLSEDEAKRRRRGVEICGIPIIKPSLVEITAVSRAFEAIEDRGGVDGLAARGQPLTGRSIRIADGGQR